MRFEYSVIVDGDEADGYVARIDEHDTPLRGHGTSPIAALRELVRTLADWQEGGAERWLSTPGGTRMARLFCPTFEPSGGGASGQEQPS